MQLNYSPETYNLNIKLLIRPAGVVGEVMGEDLNENVVLPRYNAGKLYEIEVVGDASKVFDLSRLEVEGLPVNISPAPGERAKPSKHLRPDRNVAA